MKNDDRTQTFLDFLGEDSEKSREICSAIKEIHVVNSGYKPKTLPTVGGSDSMISEEEIFQRLLEIKNSVRGLELECLE